MRPLILLTLLATSALGDTPIDDLWQSETFRRSFTGSYGTNARIEPAINTAEREVLEKVATAMKSGKRDTAVSAFTNYDALSKSSALLFSLGNLRFEQDKLDDAIENFNNAIKLYPNFRDAHRNLAVALVRQNDFDKARPHLIRSMELGAHDGLTLGLLAYVHTTAGHHQAALQSYRLAQLSQPNELQWKLGEAEALLALNDPRATASIFDQLIAADPTNPTVWLGQADAYYRLGEIEKSIANLEIVRRMEKLPANDVIALGQLYLNQSMTESAIDCYQSAIANESDSPAFNKALDAMQSLTRYREWDAAKSLITAIEELPTYTEALKNPDHSSQLTRSKALIELESGDAEKGAALVEQLLATDPTDAQSLILLARFKEKQKDHQSAILLLEQAAKEPEYQVEALRQHGQILVNQGDYESALGLLKRAQELKFSEELSAYIQSVESLAK